MPPHHDDSADPPTSKSWAHTLRPYRTPHDGRAVVELAITLLPFCGLWAAMFFALTRGPLWLYGLLVLPTSGLLLRLFLIQHDCGHRSFFRNRRANDWIGRCVSVLTLTPYDHWRHAHAIHHATSGHLERRGVGDVDTLTVAEYQARSPWHRFRYRLYRHPGVMFGIGPAYLFLIQNRFPAGFMSKGFAPWASTMGTNLAIAAACALMMAWVGVWPFLLIQVPVVLLGAAAGVWLFYVQHQFQDTYWATSDSWDVRDAALRGSSHYDLPPVLRWFTANIGVHHVHHLGSLIPYYRRQDVLRQHPRLGAMGRLTLSQSAACIRLVLWDESSRRLVAFSDVPMARGV